MAASVISRITWTDDSGLGTDGSIINNSFLQTFQNNIDAMLAGTGSYTTLELGNSLKLGSSGTLMVNTIKSQTGAGSASLVLGTDTVTGNIPTAGTFIVNYNAIERFRIQAGQSILAQAGAESGGVSSHVWSGTFTTDKNALEILATWNAAGVAFTALEMDITSTAASAASKLMDLKVGGTSRFAIQANNGQIDGTAPSGTAATHRLSGSATGTHAFKLRHTAAGTGNFVRLSLGNDSNEDMSGWDCYTSTYTASNWNQPNGATFFCVGAGGLHLVTTHASGSIKVWTNSLQRAQFDVSGAVLVGTTVTSGSAAGDLVIANNKTIRGVNAAGTSSVGLFWLNTSNELVLNANSQILEIANASTTGTAGALVGYLQVRILGNTQKIPYYAVS